MNLLKSKNNGNSIEGTVKCERRYNIDWLRIIAFFLVFIFIVHDFSISFWNEFKEEKN
ncbi:MAG: hypothetical protein KAV01_00920 [Candidatus Lokiarchaeota archaeon]|nr:hypothetical protein [Candidatus Lokiarchaeota archaeon]